MNNLLYGTPCQLPLAHEYSEVEGMNDDHQRDIELTREALEDVDTDMVVDHQRVETWAKSLDTDTPGPLPTAARPT